MPLDEYKTQVLLLHSEQSTLDNLSSGFTDRYTVHCATSGSEALNTLVETPINVIVTAQDLPGMSGLDALREARKRSPETIGILLAGNEDDGLEALVGEEAVFQVMRGNVSGDAVLKLVENATRQMRLMALAESANDTAANPDEVGAEHIVMETSENGSTIISDGTGRLPALDPTRISAAAHLGSRAVDLLVLTKDQEFLGTIKESSRGLHNVHYANTLAQADEAIRNHGVGVAVIDAAMVGDKVEQLTVHLRKSSQRLVSVVAGRRDDGEMLMDLINRGKVYRFLMKPVSPGRARLAIEASIKHHLEAPDATFGAKSTAPATQAPLQKAAAKPAAKVNKVANKPPLQKPAPAAETSTSTQSAADNAAPTKPTNRVEPTLSASPLEQGLGDAFGEDDNSFTETVTGLISSVSAKFSGTEKVDAEKAVGNVETDSAAPQQQAAPSAAGGSKQKNPMILGIAATAVLVIVGSLFWFMSGSDDPTESVQEDLAKPSISEAEVAFAPEPEPEVVTPDVDADALFEEARLARNAGQVFNPTGGNAIELYAAAVAADPRNADAAAELESAMDEALSMAETAMLEARLDDADAAISRVGQAKPDHSRLPFLSAQLSQMQIGGHLTAARTAIREDRFEDAATALSAARNLNPADVSEIDAVGAELVAARSDQQVDEVLARAVQKLDEGELLSPANDNARYYYGLVLSNDPNNSTARQGMNIIASRVAEQAEAAIARGDFSGAETLLASARQADAGNSDIADAATALANARTAAAERQQRAEADRLAAEQAVEEAQLAAAEAARQEQQRLDALALEPLAAAESADSDVAAADNAAEGEDVDSSVAPLVANLADNKGTGSSGAAESTQSQPPAAVSSLNRIKYVAPKYPRSAQRRNISGWVDVVFTVDVDGTVKDAEARDAEPGETFTNSALSAVEKWKFEPVVENGRIVEKRAGVRMMFALE